MIGPPWEGPGPLGAGMEGAVWQGRFGSVDFSN